MLLSDVQYMPTSLGCTWLLYGEKEEMIELRMRSHMVIMYDDKQKKLSRWFATISMPSMKQRWIEPCTRSPACCHIQMKESREDLHEVQDPIMQTRYAYYLAATWCRELYKCYCPNKTLEAQEAQEAYYDMNYNDNSCILFVWNRMHWMSCQDYNCPSIAQGPAMSQVTMMLL